MLPSQAQKSEACRSEDSQHWRQVKKCAQEGAEFQSKKVKGAS